MERHHVIEKLTAGGWFYVRHNTREMVLTKSMSLRHPEDPAPKRRTKEPAKA